MKKKKRREVLVVLSLLVILLVLASLTMVYGDKIYSFSTIWQVLCGAEIKSATFTIKSLRLPRMLTGLLAGVAFGMAGNTFQSLLRNSLASPDIIGVTSGAGLAAVFSILVLGLSGNKVSFIAIVAGLLVSVISYLVSAGNGYCNTRMILVGIGMQAFLQALISWILLKASQYDVATALRWLSGSLNGVLLENVPRLALVVLVAGGIILYLNSSIMMLSMGEEYAVTLGVKTNRVRMTAMICGILLVAVATSVTGPIASVAFLSGPIASRLVGKGRNNMVAAGLVGAVLVLGADLIGQNAWKTRYPVGVITGLLGAPYLLFLLINMNRKGGRG